jgi:alkylhydroperoxidase family enzyme
VIVANIGQHRKALIARIGEGAGTSTNQDRREALAGSGPERARALLAKVTQHAYRVTDEDIAAAKAGGLTEDQIFELVVCAAVGQANRQLESALAALDEATNTTNPAAAVGE